MKKLIRLLRAPLLALIIFLAGAAIYEPALLSTITSIAPLKLTEYGSAPNTAFLDSGCGKGGSSKFDACGIAPCAEPFILRSAPLNDGLPIVRCLTEQLPHPPKIGAAITIGRFDPGPTKMMFYAQKGDRFVPAYSYEELGEVLGGIDSVEKAKVFLTGVLEYSGAVFLTSVTDTGKDYFVENLYLGGTGRCDYLTRLNGRLGRDGAFLTNYDSRKTVKQPASSCPSD